MYQAMVAECPNPRPPNPPTGCRMSDGSVNRLSDGSVNRLLADGDVPSYGGVHHEESAPMSSRQGGGKAKVVAALVCVLAMGEGYDFAIFATVLARLREDIEMSSQTVGLITSCVYIGMIVGALSSGPVADWLGRKKAICAACFFLVAGSSVQASAAGISVVVAGRIIMGIGMGSGLPLGSTFIVEIAPKELRGSLGSGLGTCFALGTALGALAGVVLQDTWHDWRVMLLLGACLPAAVLLGTLSPWFPESPRWLALQGDMDAARHSLQQLAEDSSSVEETLQEIMESPRRLKGGSDMADSWVAVLRPRPEHRQRIILSFAVLVSAFICGFPSLALYMPTFLAEDLGRKRSVQALGMIMSTAALLSVASAPAALYVGRRTFLLGGYAVMVASYLQLGYCTSPWGLVSGSTRGWLFAAIWLIVSCAYVVGINTATSFYSAEVLPVELRATGSGVGTAISRCVAFVMTALMPLMHERLGWIFWTTFAGSSALVFAFLYRAARETQGVPLEHIDRIFRSSSKEQDW